LLRFPPPIDECDALLPQEITSFVASVYDERRGVMRALLKLRYVRPSMLED